MSLDTCALRAKSPSIGHCVASGGIKAKSPKHLLDYRNGLRIEFLTQQRVMPELPKTSKDYTE